MGLREHEIRLYPPSPLIVPHKSQSSPPRASLPGMSEVLIVSLAARNPEIDSLPTQSLPLAAIGWGGEFTESSWQS